MKPRSGNPVVILRGSHDLVAEVHAAFPGVIGRLGMGSNPPRAYTIFGIDQEGIFRVYGKGGATQTHVTFEVYYPKSSPVPLERKNVEEAVSKLKTILETDKYQVGHDNIFVQSKK